MNTHVQPEASPAASRASARPLLGFALAGTVTIAACLVSDRLGASVLLSYGASATCGLCAGFLSGLLGIGGALVVVPALYLLLPVMGVDSEQLPYAAIATALVVMLPSSAVGAWSHQRHGALNRQWLARLAPGMVLGATIGTLCAQQLRGPVLTMLFVLQSLYYGACLLRPIAAPDSWQGRFARAACGWPAAAIGPLIAGFSACAGMGAGSLLVPYFTGKHLPMLHAVATAGSLNLCISLGGLAGFLITSTPASSVVHWPAALLIGGLAVCAVPTGVAVAHRMPLAGFRRALAIVTLTGALALAVRTLCFASGT